MKRERERAVLGWAALIGVATAGELLALKGGRRHYTLSHATRRVCHTETRLGAVAFCAAWALLTFWFVPHILTDPGASNDQPR